MSLLVAFLSTNRSHAAAPSLFPRGSAQPSVDELLWEFGARPDLASLDDHLLALGCRDMVPWPRREDAPRDRGQERVDAQRAEAEARERLDERIKQLREQGEAAPPAVLAELAAAIYQRNGRHESAETTRVLKVLETAIRSLGSRASLDLWERLGIEYYPQIDSKKNVLLNPTFRAIAASVAPRVEALAGTVSGQDTIRLAIALRGVARWRSSDASKSQQLQDAQNKNPKGVEPARTRAERPSLAGMPVWQSEFKRAIKEGVAGARDAYAECVRRECRVMELQWLQDFVSEYGQVDGLCLIEVKEILAERYLRETNAPELQARGVEIIEDLLRIPTWSSWGCRSGLDNVVAGIPQRSPLARGDVIPRLMQRNIAIGGPDGIYFRGSERLTRARDGDAAAMLEVADWCDPALHPGACMSPVGRLVDLDERRSLLWRVRAACSGDGSAAYAVGLMALDGRGCAPSHPIALRWFRLAASRGSVSALRAIVREMGRGGIEAQQESVDWCEPLARAGEPDAMFLLGTQQLREALVSDTAGAANAFALIEGAAKGGSVGAMVFLADRYASMPQVGPAALQALHWRQEAAESGDIRSMVEFARALPGNCNDSKRLSRALELVGNAVDQGAPDAESVALALLDRTDQCGEQRLNALELYRSLARMGNWQAMVAVAERCQAGIVIPKDDAEAYYWLTIAVTRAPADKQPELAGRRDAAGEKLDPAARGEVQARCRDYRPAAPVSSMSSK